LLNDEPFAVLLPDVLVLDQISRGMNNSFSSLLNAWNTTGVGQVMVERVAKSTVENYGVVDIGGHTAKPFSSMKINKLVEKPSCKDAPSDLAVLGRYILPSAVLDLLENTGQGVGGEIQLTDALDALLEICNLNAFLTDASTFDCGSKQGLLGANLALGMRDAQTKKYLMELSQKNNWSLSF